MIPEHVYDESRFLKEWELYIAYQNNKAVYDIPGYLFYLN
jgi:hypothetical protein